MKLFSILGYKEYHKRGSKTLAILLLKMTSRDVDATSSFTDRIAIVARTDKPIRQCYLDSI